MLAKQEIGTGHHLSLVSGPAYGPLEFEFLLCFGPGNETELHPLILFICLFILWYWEIEFRASNLLGRGSII
jgi:hypothetical protein